MAGGPSKLDSPTPRPTPLTMVVYTVKCAILSQNEPAFPIQMDETKTVGDLKAEIKRYQLLHDVVASHLELYKVHISIPDREAYKQVMKAIHSGSVSLGEELDYPDRELSEFESGFPPKVIHILVKVPQPTSESFSSKPGPDVVGIVLIIAMLTPLTPLIVHH